MLPLEHRHHAHNNSGIFHEVTVGAVLTVEGNWRVDKRYGRQFAAEKWTEELPADIIGIDKYLGSGLVKGIGPKMDQIIQQIVTICQQRDLGHRLL